MPWMVLTPWATPASQADPPAVASIFKTPWPGDPRVNIQNNKGRAKAYQVRQVLLAIDRLKEKR